LRSCGKNGAIPFTVPNKPKDSIDETVAVNRSSVMPAVSKSADFTNKKKSSKKPLIILLTILIAAICIAVGALLPSLLNKNNDADEQKEENISSDKKTEEDINDDASIDFLTDNTDTAANSDIIHNNAIPDITENSENIITPDTEDTEPDPIPPEEPAVQGNTTWNLKDGILTISGSGDMDNYSDDFDVYYEDIEEYAYTNSPWDYHRFDITEVIIEDGVTSVGNNAFYGCNKLTKVTLPESITKIGNYAFSSTDSLQNIDIPSTSRYTFYDEKMVFGSLTLFEEIFCGEENPDLKKMQDILEHLHLWQEISSNCIDVWKWMKEKKFNNSLSNGQKQRLVLAKMLYWLDDSIDVVVLDECTSGLDDITEDNSVDAQTILEYIILYCNKHKLRIVVISTHQNISKAQDELSNTFGFTFQNLRFQKQSERNLIKKI